MNFTKAMMIASLCIGSVALQGASHNSALAKKSFWTSDKWDVDNKAWGPYLAAYPAIIGAHLCCNSEQVLPALVPYLGPLYNFILSKGNWHSHTFTTAETAVFAAAGIAIGSWLASDGSFKSFKKQLPRTTLTLCAGYASAKAAPYALSAVGTSLHALHNGLASSGAFLNDSMTPATLIGTVAVGTGVAWYGYEYYKDKKKD